MPSRISTHPTEPRSKSSTVQVPITSSWCRRALRPLTSTILRLEKHWKAVPVELQECAIRLPDGVSRTASRRDTRTAGDDASGSESPPDDPTWVPGKVVQRRVKHRYSGRRQYGRVGRSKVIARSPETQRLRPGEFTVATPLVLGRGQGRHDVTEDNGDVADGRTDGEGGSEQHVRRKSSKRKLLPSLVEQVSSRDASDEYRDPSYLTIAHGIHNTWSAFLRMTASNGTPSGGARSLLSMSLNKVSEYIVHEQERLNNLDDKDEDTDVVDYMITELEGAYALSNQGWKPLKELARAHGIRLLCDAVRNKWISPMLSRLLILRAVEESFYDAAEALLSALLSISPAIQPPGRLDGCLFSLESNIALNTLYIYTDKTGRWGFMFRELGVLVSHGVLPAEWMATDTTKPLMANAIQAISGNSGHSQHSVRFIATVLQATVGIQGSGGRLSAPKSFEKGTKKQTRHSDANSSKDLRSSEGNVRPSSQDVLCDEFISTALSNTMSSVLTILCGAHLARSDPEQSRVSDSTPMHGLIKLVSTAVQHDMALRGVSEYYSGLQSLRVGFTLMADYILSCTETGDDDTKVARRADEFPSCPVGKTVLHNFESFLGRVSNRAELVTEFSQLVLQVSRCWGRARGEDEFTQIKHLTDTLTPVRTNSGSSKTLRPFPILQAVLNKVAVEVALNFAELTCLRDHHAWALQVQETVTVTAAASGGGWCRGEDGPVPWTPSLALSVRGFRWEDGIGEWVARSPVVERQGRVRNGVVGAAAANAGSCLPASSVTGRSSHGGTHSQTQTPRSSEESEESEEFADERSTPASSVDGAPEFESSPSVSRGKRKSMSSDEELHSDNKRRKAMDDGVVQRLRRRRTVAGCGMYVDRRDHEDEDEEDEDDNWNSGSDLEHVPSCANRRSFRHGRSRSTTATRRRLTEIPTTTTTTTSSSSSTRRRAVDHPGDQARVEVAIRVPGRSPQTTATSTTAVAGSSKRTTDFEIVIPTTDSHNHDHHRQQQQQQQQQQRYQRSVSPRSALKRPGEADSTSSDDDDDDEDDIFVNAPVLRDRMGKETKRGLRSSTGSSSSSSSYCKSTAGQPARKDDEVVIPCSQESSEDELSFI